MLVETARSLLAEEGLGTGLERITFKRVFDHLAATRGVRVTNASVIGRIWSDQAAFQTDVLVTIAEDDSSWERDQTVARLQEILDRLDTSSLHSRYVALQQVCRLGGEANLDAMKMSPNWDVWISIWAYAYHRKRSGSEDSADEVTRRTVRSSLQKSYDLVTEDYGQLYPFLASLLGFKVRAPLTFDQLAMAVTALAEGCGLRDRVEPASTRAIMRPTGDQGALEAWTLLGIGLEALALQFLEPDPDWKLPA